MSLGGDLTQSADYHFQKQMYVKVHLKAGTVTPTNTRITASSSKKIQQFVIRYGCSLITESDLELIQKSITHHKDDATLFKVVRFVTAANQSMKLNDLYNRFQNRQNKLKSKNSQININLVQLNKYELEIGKLQKEAKACSKRGEEAQEVLASEIEGVRVSAEAALEEASRRKAEIDGALKDLNNLKTEVSAKLDKAEKEGQQLEVEIAETLEALDKQIISINAKVPIGQINDELNAEPPHGQMDDTFLNRTREVVAQAVSLLASMDKSEKQSKFDQPLEESRRLITIQSNLAKLEAAMPKNDGSGFSQRISRACRKLFSSSKSLEIQRDVLKRSLNDQKTILNRSLDKQKKIWKSGVDQFKSRYVKQELIDAISGNRTLAGLKITDSDYKPINSREDRRPFLMKLKDATIPEEGESQTGNPVRDSALEHLLITKAVVDKATKILHGSPKQVSFGGNEIKETREKAIKLSKDLSNGDEIDLNDMDFEKFHFMMTNYLNAHYVSNDIYKALQKALLYLIDLLDSNSSFEDLDEVIDQTIIRLLANNEIIFRSNYNDFFEDSAAFKTSIQNLVAAPIQAAIQALVPFTQIKNSKMEEHIKKAIGTQDPLVLSKVVCDLIDEILESNIKIENANSLKSVIQYVIASKINSKPGEYKELANLYGVIEELFNKKKAITLLKEKLTQRSENQ